MRHFGHLAPQVRKELFHCEPAEFTADSPIPTLSAALGATLYTPADRPRLAEDIRRQAARGVVSMVACLEDAVEDDRVEAAEANLVEQFARLDPAAGPSGGTALPLLFIRVRAPGQITDLLRRLGPAADRVCGFVLPKFTEQTGAPFLAALTAAEADAGRRLLAMPVLESPQLLHLESRRETLLGIARTVAEHRERILAVRLGVTDFGAAYGLRRPSDMTAYDVQVIAAAIGDVVNVLGRADGTGFTLTGPVWEYFPRSERIFKPQLRRTPFAPDAEELRTELIEHDIDGLLREVELDRANGLLGKTCIHPSHVAPVHALSVVSHEEYCDAADIWHRDRRGGVLRSAYTNKMNEVKPHRAWAERTLRRAGAFGVAREGVTFVELLAAALEAA